MKLDQAICRARELADTISDAVGIAEARAGAKALVVADAADAEALEVILAGLEEPPPLVPDEPKKRKPES